MLLEAPLPYINYIESSAHFLNCPTHMFNHDLHAIYRQFYYNGVLAITYQLATLLYTWGYSKSEAYKTADELYEFYSNISTQEFNKLNKNWEVIPERMEIKNREVTNYIERGTTYYPFTGIKKHVPNYPFKKGYKLKEL